MNTVNLKDITDGALQEKFQTALQEVFCNMQDPNTPWKNKREIVIKLKFVQNEDRDDVSCEISVEKKLAQTKPVGYDNSSANRKLSRFSANVSMAVRVSVIGVFVYQMES